MATAEPSACSVTDLFCDKETTQVSCCQCGPGIRFDRGVLAYRERLQRAAYEGVDLAAGGDAVRRGHRGARRELESVKPSTTWTYKNFAGGGEGAGAGIRGE